MLPATPAALLETWTVLIAWVKSSRLPKADVVTGANSPAVPWVVNRLFAPVPEPGSATPENWTKKFVSSPATVTSGAPLPPAGTW